MEIKLKHPVPNQAPHYTSLYVNGIHLGEYIYGKDKKYLNPKKWAKEQIKKRNIVLDRNIKRLKIEISELEKEKKIINN